MALPVGWPPRPASGRRSIRAYIGANTTANFSDNAYLFYDIAGANTYQATPIVAPGAERTTVAFGPAPTTGAGGSPMGGGQNDPKDPKPMIWSNSMMIYNDGASDIEFSFDGTTVQGVIKAGQSAAYYDRYEAGIAVRGVGGAVVAFRVEAW